MKRFEFSLERLLRYKEQVFDAERAVLADMNARLAALHQELEDLLQEMARATEDFRQKCAGGVTAPEIARYKTYLNALGESIRQKEREIALQRQAIDRQTDKVREAKIEISTMEKLREKKLEEYNYLENKQNELFIEEFVSNQKATQAG